MQRACNVNAFTMLVEPYRCRSLTLYLHCTEYNEADDKKQMHSPSASHSSLRRRLACFRLPAHIYGSKARRGLRVSRTRRMLYSDTYAHKLQPICARPETPRALSSVVRSSDKGFRRAGSCAWEVAADESGLHERARTRGQVVQEDTMLLLRHTCRRSSAYKWSCLFLFSVAQGCSISGQVTVCLFSTSSIIYETNLTEGA